MMEGVEVRKFAYSFAVFIVWSLLLR